jgi:hypothetical protein
MAVSDTTGDPDEPSTAAASATRGPVAEDRPAPDVMFHFRIAAFCCGLGEIGWSKLFLTPEFGPRQRFAFMLTDAPLEPDPLYDGPPLCDRCMACVARVPGGRDQRRREREGHRRGRELEWGKLAEWDCFHGYMGSNRETNPFLPEDAFDDFPTLRQILAGEANLPRARRCRCSACCALLRLVGGVQLRALRRAGLPARLHGAPRGARGAEQSVR